MQIQLPIHIEQSILAAFRNGDYDRVAEELAAAVRSNGASINIEVASAAEERRRSWEKFEEPIDVEKLAEEQGVKPLGTARDLVFPGWPEGESVDDFIAAAKGYEHS